MMKLPLFPLHVVLFPGMPLDLHIFEPRYRVMMRACIDRQQPFGVVLIRQGMEALGPLAEPYQVGCMARIAQVERLEDGRMNLTAIGEERFKIIGLDQSQPYLVGDVAGYPLENPSGLVVARGLKLLNEMVRTYLKVLAKQSEEAVDLSQFELPEDAQAVLYTAAALLQIPNVEKQPLLESLTAGILLEHLIRLYRRELALAGPDTRQDEDRARRSAWLN